MFSGPKTPRTARCSTTDLGVIKNEITTILNLISTTYLGLAEDNGCEIEDLPTLMIERDCWKEIVNTCQARSTR